MLKFFLAAILVCSAGFAFAATTTSIIVGTSATTVLSSIPVGRTYVSISNQSASATIACAHGAIPSLNGAGSINIPALTSAVWRGGHWSSSDSWSCVSDTVATPVTVETQP